MFLLVRGSESRAGMTCFTQPIRAEFQKGLGMLSYLGLERVVSLGEFTG